MPEGSAHGGRSEAPDAKAARLLARSLFQDLRGRGYTDEHVLALTSELLGLVASELRDRRDARRKA
jgi:hypothetical protein